MRTSIFVSVVALVSVACGDEPCPAGYLEDAAGNCLQADTRGSSGGGSGKGAEDGSGGGNGGVTGGNAGGSSSGSNGGGAQGDTSTDVLLVNDTDGWEITELYISPCDATSWGNDQLSGSVFEGEDYVVTNVPNGCYDMIAWSWNGAALWENYGADLSGGTYEFTLR